jgi:CRP-like cAMP-binding protein
MRQLFFLGKLSTNIELIEEMMGLGFSVTILTNLNDNLNRSLLLVALDDQNSAILNDIKNQPVVWIARCLGQPELVTQAYQAGAIAVFPKATDTGTICQFIERQDMQSTGTGASTVQINTIQRRYKRGDFILLDTEMVLEIKQGIIAKMMIHRDGCEVLLGLFGKNDTIFPHPADNCYIQLVAQTDCIIGIEPQTAAEKRQGFTNNLRYCLQKVEAWAAMQARPHLDQRLLGILSLLAEEFGHTVDQGRLMDLRLTHAQLASAIGSTRATVTRTLTDLKNQGKLIMVNTADGERYCLLEWEQCSHTLQ